VSKLPVISGADCVKALRKTGFKVYRQRGSHIVMVRLSPPTQTTVPNHKELDRSHAPSDHPPNDLAVEEFIALL
jgi:predicted RNA binding protein YcfA (HicA-like mRNA interferase family)